MAVNNKTVAARKLAILFLVSSCYYFKARGLVSVVRSIVLSKVIHVIIYESFYMTRTDSCGYFSSLDSKIIKETSCGSFLVSWG